MEVQSVCEACGEPIVLVGEAWDHIGSIKPRHIATPRTFTIPKIAPSQRDTDFIRGFAKPQPAGWEARMWDVESLERLVNQVIDERSVRTDFYFVSDPSKLVSYGYVREVITRTDADVERLAARVAKLDRPWWRRWFR
jgi:hypothetical protein